MGELRSPSRLELLRLALRARSLRALLRALEILLALRRITPRPGERVSTELVYVEPAADTGAGFRPKHRPQDPAKDPAEPNGGESSSRGTDHGWSGCTMSSGADAFAYQSHYQGRSSTPWGGDLRHDQSDLEGGTDLNDLRQAWAERGEELSIRSGSGWDAVKTAHGEGRAIVIQGSGNVPGSATFDGGHACSIAPESNGDGDWLWGDPLVSDWQWVPPGKIRDWAEHWQGSIAFAVSRKPPTEPPPPKPPPAEPIDTTPYDQADVDRAVQSALVEQGDQAVGSWLGWLRAPLPGLADHWDAGSWADPASLLVAELGGDPCQPGLPGHWARELVPQPAADAYRCLVGPSVWGLSGWRQATWASQ